ncbi:DUF2589 domain-containing protein [Pseudoalteromonas rubra]|uniref:DUF2589 domain-containing protein n=1 Tax=Pseudoalteromonas rubra TaxID=43658 RepID=UPI000F788D93|nr:DUF2589 domain-containing protein [Pseudoalteromonas rubra]
MNNNIASQFAGLPMKALIGAPLKAATDANAMIANAQTQFILSTCFEKDSHNHGHLTPVMVTFTLSRSVLEKDGSISKTPYEMDISIPLMTLIPINSLAIEKLKVSFSMEVKSSREIKKQTSQESKQSRAQTRQPEHAHEFETELHGALAKSGNQSLQQSGSAHANYEVMLEAGQLPLPRGITTILDIFAKNLTPLPPKNED